MLPVVDSNWHSENCASTSKVSGDYHVLRAVVVQPEQTHAESLADLAFWTKRATTPGSGGLPQALVAYCKLDDNDALAQLSYLSVNDRVRGVSYDLEQFDITRLSDRFDYLAQHKLSLDIISCDVAFIDAVIAIASENTTLKIILNISRLHRNGKPLAFQDWHEVAAALIDQSNVFLKLTGHLAGGPDHIEKELSEDIRKLVKEIKIDRLLLAGSTTLTEQPGSDKSIWSRYAALTQWANASERHKLFRSNAMHVYRLS